MESVLKSDIFFFITSVVAIVVGIGFLVALFYLIRILNDLKNLSSLARTEGEKISADLSELRANVRESGFRQLFSLWRGFFGRRKKGRKNLKED